MKPVPSGVSLFDAATLRTLFFQFENEDWEKELMAFKETDVDVPATLTVDGVAYKNVGVQFRGASSFMMVPVGEKHSIDVHLDAVDENQALLGYRSLNLLNSHEDPSHLKGVLYLHVARQYVPAAQANFVRVALNGESWGVYPSVEQVNKDFIQKWFKTAEGARWKVPGSPNGRGGLEYFGADLAAYKRTFEIKTKDDDTSWAALVTLTKVLNETPLEKLEAALTPLLDLDGTLRFLALENVLVNNDGYWTRASDYNIYLDPKGQFHVFPHDVNETFGPASGAMGGRGGFPGGRPAGPGGPRGFGPGGPGSPGGPAAFPGAGPGGRQGGGPGGRGRGGMMMGDARLDLLVGLDDATKPLRSRLLAVPSLRQKYLVYARDIADTWLDWNKLGPVASRYHELIAPDVRADVHKLDSTEDFDKSLAALKTFADERRAFVMAATEAAR